MEKMKEKVCPECGNWFVCKARKGNEKIYCSKKCYLSHANRTRLENYYTLKALKSAEAQPPKEKARPVILNFTGKTVTVQNDGSELFKDIRGNWIIPSIGEAQVNQEVLKDEGFDRITLYIRNLPDPKKGVVYLVNKDVALILSHERHDLVICNGIFSKDEKEVFCKGLGLVYTYSDFGAVYDEQRC